MQPPHDDGLYAGSAAVAGRAYLAPGRPPLATRRARSGGARTRADIDAAVRANSAAFATHMGGILVRGACRPLATSVAALPRTFLLDDVAATNLQAILFFLSHCWEQWTRPVAQKLLCVMCARVLPGEHSSSTFAHAWSRSTRAAHHTLLTRCMHLPQLTTTTTITITTHHHFFAAHPQLFGVALMFFGSFILMPRLESRVRLCATASTRNLAFLHSLDQIDRTETFKSHVQAVAKPRVFQNSAATELVGNVRRHASRAHTLVQCRCEICCRLPHPTTFDSAWTAALVPARFPHSLCMDSCTCSSTIPTFSLRVS
jgi:hypothetical protein